MFATMRKSRRLFGTLRRNHWEVSQPSLWVGHSGALSATVAKSTVPSAGCSQKRNTATSPAHFSRGSAGNHVESVEAGSWTARCGSPVGFVDGTTACGWFPRPSVKSTIHVPRFRRMVSRKVVTFAALDAHLKRWTPYFVDKSRSTVCASSLEIMLGFHGSLAQRQNRTWVTENVPCKTLTRTCACSYSRCTGHVDLDRLT